MLSFPSTLALGGGGGWSRRVLFLPAALPWTSLCSSLQPFHMLGNFSEY